MKLLFVAPATSLHTARWLAQLSGLGWELHLFPVEPYPLHPELRDVTLHHPLLRRRPFDDRDLARADFLATVEPSPRGVGQLLPKHSFDASVRQRGIWWPFRDGAVKLESWAARLFPAHMSRAARLARTIDKLTPDLVHSLEIFTAGYLTMAALDRVAGAVPAWAVNNWGDDLFWYGRQDGHRDRLCEVLRRCQYYGAECRRDMTLARDMGFTGSTLPVVPNSGGFDLAAIEAWRQPGPASQRRLIVLKGYQGWSGGRALVALQAIEQVASALQGYRLVVFGAQGKVRAEAALVGERTGLPVEIMPWQSHEAVLRLHGQARVSIGLSVTDGIPTTLIEALAMGSFPIQSGTGCANEWITDGRTGSIVPAEDPQALASALVRALDDDELIDRAAQENWRLTRERLDGRVIRAQVIEAYQQMAAGVAG